MPDLLLLLDAESITPAVGLAASLPGCRARVFDPTLIDRARQSGLAEVEYLPWRPVTPHDELCRWAEEQARAVDRRLQLALAAIDDRTDVQGWQQLNLYYQFRTLRWYSELWAAQVDSLGDALLHLPVCDNTAQYYWPSFLPAVLLLQRLRASGREFRGFTFGARADLWQQVPDIARLALRGDEVLTHLPTCFYDAAYFADELAAAGHPVVNLQARQWDVLVPGARQVPLTPLETALAGLPQSVHERLQAQRASARAVMDEALRPWLPSSSYRERQASGFADMLHAQLAVSALLDAQDPGTRPQRLLMSEHDSGFHGPLLSWARRRGVPTLLVPHSKTMTDIEFPTRGCTVFTHALQGEAPLDAQRQQVRHATLAYPETLRCELGAAPALRTVGLLLNGLALGGVIFSPYDDYTEGIQRIAEWCRRHGLALAVRSRPGQVLAGVLQQHAGLDAEQVQAGSVQSLKDFVGSVDLCLMYDAPTNAASEFLRAGVPILNLVIDALSRSERLTCNEQVVPRMDLAAALQTLEHFVADPTRTQLFRQRQFARYVQALEPARPLRHWL